LVQFEWNVKIRDSVLSIAIVPCSASKFYFAQITGGKVITVKHRRSSHRLKLNI